MPLDVPAAPIMGALAAAPGLVSWTAPPTREAPAQWGRRRHLVKVLSLGLATPKAGREELAHRENERLIRAAMHWAAGLGAITAWAQVATTNAASLALQRRVGLREVYRYRYLIRPGTP